MIAPVDQASCPESLFGEVLDYIEQAQAQLAKRDPIALAEMNNTVDALAARLAALPLSAVTEYAPELEHLAARMKHLQAGMVDLQHEISASIASLGHQKKASRAYNHTPTGMTEE